MEAKPIEPGMVVRLKSGGKSMTAGKVGHPSGSSASDDPVAQCFWFDGPRFCWDSIPLPALEESPPVRTIRCGHCGLYVVIP